MKFLRVLSSEIFEVQSALIPRRSIVDNVLIAFESSHAMNRQKGCRGGHWALKFDMSKAYNRVEWDFLRKAMLAIGFSERWVQLMRECISTVRFHVLVGREGMGTNCSNSGPLSRGSFVRLRTKIGNGVMPQNRMTFSEIYY